MKPILKWAGGKTRLLPNIKKYLPESEKVNRYFEPFAGGAALYFDYGYKCGQAYLNDINQALANTYWYLPRAWDDIEDTLCELMEVPYDTIRSNFNSNLDLRRSLPCVHGNAQEVAEFIALNHLCYNGLWRENKKGEFNVPLGKDSKGNPRLLTSLNFDNLREGAKVLKNATVKCGSFDPWPFDIYPEAGDVVFYDSPYLGEFSAYDSSGFTRIDHEHLYYQATCFADRGATVVVCGSNNVHSHAVYGMPTEVIELNRTIGHAKRGKATEALYVFTI